MSTLFTSLTKENTKCYRRLSSTRKFTEVATAMESMKNNSYNQNVFERNPKKTIATAILISFLILDCSFTNIYRYTILLNYTIKWTYPSLLLHLMLPKKIIEIKSNIYHHDFAKNSFAIRLHGHLKPRIYTSSLGFKDRSSRKISLVTDKE